MEANTDILLKCSVLLLLKNHHSLCTEISKILGFVEFVLRMLAEQRAYTLHEMEVSTILPALTLMLPFGGRVAKKVKRIYKYMADACMTDSGHLLEMLVRAVEQEADPGAMEC